MDRRRGRPLSWHSRAPTRIDFGGGWTDVPDYADRAGGIVVNCAISRYVRVDVLPGGSGIRLNAEDIGERVRYASSGEIRYDGRLDLHKAALNMFPVTGGVEVLSRCDFPQGSGLGGSGALDVALVAALSRARGDWFDRAELAELGFRLEAGELKLLGGRQDQYAAALGAFHELTFGGGGTGVRQLAVSPELGEELGRHLVLLYSGHSHFSPATHHQVWTAWNRGDSDVSDALRAIGDVGRALGKPLESGDWREVARLVDENWRQQQRLDATISTSATQTIERAVRAAGAWGLKATGAGAGGCLVVLGPADRREAIATAAERVGAERVDMGFDFEGVSTWQEGDGDEPG